MSLNLVRMSFGRVCPLRSHAASPPKFLRCRARAAGYNRRTNRALRPRWSLGMTTEYCPVPLPDFREYPLEEMRRRATDFYELVSRRHTVRGFSPRAVPRDIIDTCVRAAGTAPNGANHQPW